MKKINQQQLNEILRKHKLWLNCEIDGEKADLRYTDLRYTDLEGANLRYADLRYTDLEGANLIRANLEGANLEGAYLEGAYLVGANLENIKINCYTIGYHLSCPEEGSFIGYKKANNCLIKLLILEDSKRSSATTSKCRCDKAKVLEIINLETNENIESITSDYDDEFIYRVNEIVKVDNFNEDRWYECAIGIHFFMNKENALNYN